MRGRHTRRGHVGSHAHVTACSTGAEKTTTHSTTTRPWPGMGTLRTHRHGWCRADDRYGRHTHTEGWSVGALGRVTSAAIPTSTTMVQMTVTAVGCLKPVKPQFLLPLLLQQGLHPRVGVNGLLPRANLQRWVVVYV